MSKSLAFATLAALLGACVINDDVDDDDGADTGTNPSTDPSTDPSTTDPSTTDPSTTDPSTTASTTDASTTDLPSDTGTTEEPSDTGSTGAEGSCGWGRTGEKTIPEGYICGGEGEDPSGLMPSTCAEGVELVEGGDCGGEMGITGVGCCDANGDVWFCADDGSGRQLFTQDC